ncbi:hypothetical protein BDN70DRAFT_797452 [Pholiota conissans]|uniref:Uncharacterized protein n=1 Tax=Pholiota conissans TaxID=109636 RepID=A0A9P5ZAF1_9AGAR|nr:hypothetical protein BDN70DRAFT_797452 [Pholiota conissans]
MATLIQDPRQPHSWSTPNLNGNGFTTASAPNPNQRYSYTPHPSRATQNAPPMNVNGGSTSYDSLPTLPPHNEVEMTREMLVHVLEHFSTLLPKYFDWKIVQGMVIPPSQGMRFVVHGGACMLLHEGLYALSVQQQTASPSLATRTTTRDIDYIHRGFIAEYGQSRFPDAAERLKACIKETARKFGLGADWMNSDADIALPMAHDPTGKLYDPIYTVSVTPQNMNLHTIYKSSNGFLTLVSVTPFWAVALKLVRYTKWDPVDICLLLR